MAIRLIHVDQLKTLYLCYGSSVNLGSFGVTRVKRSFSLKCCKSSILHSMTIGPIHVDQLETLYIFYGVKCQSGVIWGHWVQRLFSLKML